MSADITLGGEGYMVALGTYRRAQDGAAEGRTGRLVVRDFFGGQRRAVQLERDRSWDSVGVGPVFGGQGVEPWPYQTAYQDGVLGTVSTVRAPHLVVGDHAYLAVGSKLFRTVALAGVPWADFTQVADVGAAVTITQLVAYQGDLLLLCGNALDIQRYDTATGTVTTFVSGLRARIGIGYAQELIFADPSAGNEARLRMTTGATPAERALDAPIVAMGVFQGQVAIATRQSLWLLGGQVDPTDNTWTRDPEPFFSHGIWAADDDFLFLLSYGGRLYTWLNNDVAEWNPSGSKAGWRSCGLEGRSCHGATVAGNHLIVAMTTRLGDSELWAFDGTGWWLLLRSVGPAPQTRVWPMHTGGAGNYDLAVFRAGSTSVTYDLFRMVWRSVAAHTYPATASFRTSLLDAGERDKAKIWRKAGAVFAAPQDRGDPASVDPVTLDLALSLDAGASFTPLASVVADPVQRTLTLDGEVNGAISRFAQVRLSWSSVSDWAPVLVGLWLEYELLDAPALRRRWSFSIQARDQTVDRAGNRDSRDGRMVAADLWSAWRSGTTMVLRDVDFAATEEEIPVRIVGIREEIAKPADAGRWGDSVIQLTLLES